MSSSALSFEALDDVFGFDSTPPSRKPAQDDEDMDFDVDAEIAMMQEEEERTQQRRYDDSPPPHVEEEPDWDENMETMEIATVVKSVVTTTSSRYEGKTGYEGKAVTQTANGGAEDGFGESDIFDFPIASCKFPSFAGLINSISNTIQQ